MKILPNNQIEIYLFSDNSPSGITKKPVVFALDEIIEVSTHTEEITTYYINLKQVFSNPFGWVNQFYRIPYSEYTQLLALKLDNPKVTITNTHRTIV